MPRFAERIAFAARLAFGRWQPPALTSAQTWEGLPDWWTGPDDPARDAIGAGLAYVYTQVASDAARMSMMHLRKHARGWALDLVAAASGLARQNDERDEALRARIAIVEDAVTPNAIAAAAAAIVPGAQVISPARHGFYVGRTHFGRAPVDHLATRAAAALPGYDGRLRLYTTVGPARLWVSPARGRFHVALPPVGKRTYYGPTPTPEASRMYVGRDLAGRAQAFYSSRARATALSALASTLQRLRAAGVRWTATLDATP